MPTAGTLLAAFRDHLHAAGDGIAPGTAATLEDDAARLFSTRCGGDQA
jgi:hypothetical protein